MKPCAHDLARGAYRLVASIVRAGEVEPLFVGYHPSTFVEIEEKMRHEHCPNAFGGSSAVR